MEFCSFGTLAQQDKFSAYETLVLFKQVLDAISYLHAEGLAHRDVKPAKILVKSRMPLMVKLADFGFISQDALRTFCGTLQYAVPEIYSVRDGRRDSYTPAVDIWATGIIILELTLLNGLPAWERSWSRLDWLKQIKLCLKQTGRPDCGSLKVLAQNMLHPVPEKRPSTQVCLKQVKQIIEPSPATVTYVSVQEREESLTVETPQMGCY